MTDNPRRTLAEAERELADRLAEGKRHENIRDDCRRQSPGGGASPWGRIEDCPFAAWADTYEEDGTILVTDHERIAQVTVKQREDGEWGARRRACRRQANHVRPDILDAPAARGLT